MFFHEPKKIECKYCFSYKHVDTDEKMYTWTSIIITEYRLYIDHHNRMLKVCELKFKAKEWAQTNSSTVALIFD